MVNLHSPITMKGKFSGKTIEWKDGKLSGDEDLVNAILDYADQIEKAGRPVFIEDTCFGHRNLLATNVTAYALACMVDEMEIIDGEIPNPENAFDE